MSRLSWKTYKLLHTFMKHSHRSISSKIKFCEKIPLGKTLQVIQNWVKVHLDFIAIYAFTTDCRWSPHSWSTCGLGIIIGYFCRWREIMEQIKGITVQEEWKDLKRKRKERFKEKKIITLLVCKRNLDNINISFHDTLRMSHRCFLSQMLTEYFPFYTSTEL